MLNVQAVSTNSDIFQQATIFNECSLPDESDPKFKEIDRFLDEEIGVKEVNIKQYLEQLQQFDSSMATV